MTRYTRGAGVRSAVKVTADVDLFRAGATRLSVQLCDTDRAECPKNEGDREKSFHTNTSREEGNYVSCRIANRQQPAPFALPKRM